MTLYGSVRLALRGKHQTDDKGEGEGCYEKIRMEGIGGKPAEKLGFEHKNFL